MVRLSFKIFVRVKHTSLFCQESLVNIGKNVVSFIQAQNLKSKEFKVEYQGIYLNALNSLFMILYSLNFLCSYDSVKHQSYKD